MADFEMPENLRAPADGSARAWVAELPSLVADLAGRWSLTVGRPFQPGGTVSWVAPATGPSGEPLVLKVGRSHDEGLHEAEGLRAWGGRGAVLPGSRSGRRATP